MTLYDYVVSEGLNRNESRKGTEIWMSCPLGHKDDTPSFSIDHNNRYYCFSCHKGGGAISFVSEYKQIPLYQARRIWAGLNGEIIQNTDRERFTSIIESLAVNGHKFLRDRGISDETCMKYHIGYCDDYQSFLAREGIDQNTAKEFGLFDFSGCLIYPFYDAEGIYKIAARSVIEKSYNNSGKESKFHKDGFFGIQHVRGSEIWVFEGYHDAMVASQAGYMAVAAAGTNITKPMWNDLKGFSRIVFVPDGDTGGRAWFARLIEDMPSNLHVEFVVVPSGDPDDAILNGSFQKIKPCTPFEWSLSRFKMDTLSEKIMAIKESTSIYLKSSKTQRVLIKEWFKEKYGNDEALDYLYIDQEPDFDAERVVIANALYSNNIRMETVQLLDEEYFNSKIYRSIFIFMKDKEISSSMVQVEFGIDLSNYVDLINYTFYINKVLDVGNRIKVSKILHKANPSNVGDIVEDLYKVVDHTKASDGKQLVDRALKNINKRVNHPEELGIPIKNFPTLNKVLLGWVPGRFVLISGNSGHGKTTVACNFINDVIDDNPVLFVSLEMTEDEIIEKQISIRSGIPSMKLQTGSLHQSEYDQVVDTIKSLQHGNLQVIYGVNDLYKIIALIKAHVMRRKVRFVVIDYIQLISVHANEERWEQLSRITKTLKNQICPLGVTLLAITQLKRSALNQDVPDASEQAGAYAILADSDVALTIKKVDPKDNGGSNFMMNVSKNRFGLDSVVIPCQFERNTQQIREL